MFVLYSFCVTRFELSACKRHVGMVKELNYSLVPRLLSRKTVEVRVVPRLLSRKTVEVPGYKLNNHWLSEL